MSDDGDDPLYLDDLAILEFAMRVAPSSEAERGAISDYRTVRALGTVDEGEVELLWEDVLIAFGAEPEDPK